MFPHLRKTWRQILPKKVPIEIQWGVSKQKYSSGLFQSVFNYSAETMLQQAASRRVSKATF
jgi:hypothetical protein